MIRRFLDQPVWIRVLRGILLAAVIAVVLIYTPTPYTLQAPGRAVVASDIITIKDQHAHPVNGQFLMTTVLAEKASLMVCLYGLMDPDATLTRPTALPEGERAQSPPESGQMALSQYLSTRVALEKLGYPIQGHFAGLIVMGLTQDSPNRDVLRPGDLLLELGKATLPRMGDLKSQLDGLRPGSQLAAVVQRENARVSVRLNFTEMKGRRRIGVVLRGRYEALALPVEVDFRSGNTVGASGGLVFALEIFDQLSPTDLAKGRAIAATGTLDGEGQTGPIEGIAYKLIAAERANATVFLVPRENWDEIKNTVTKMNVIPVSTFQDALDALR